MVLRKLFLYFSLLVGGFCSLLAQTNGICVDPMDVSWTITPLPDPISNTYEANTNVTFCYTIGTFNQANGNTVIVAVDTAAFNTLPNGAMMLNGFAILPFNLTNDRTGTTFTNLGPPTFEPTIFLN